MPKRKSADKKKKAEPISAKSLPTNETKVKTPFLSNQETLSITGNNTLLFRKWLINSGSQCMHI